MALLTEDVTPQSVMRCLNDLRNGFCFLFFLFSLFLTRLDRLVKAGLLEEQQKEKQKLVVHAKSPKSKKDILSRNSQKDRVVLSRKSDAPKVCPFFCFPFEV